MLRSLVWNMVLIVGCAVLFVAASAATGALWVYASWTPFSSVVGSVARVCRPVVAWMPVGRAPEPPAHGYTLTKPHVSTSVLWDTVCSVETDVYTWEWLSAYDLRCRGGNLAAETIRTQVLISVAVWLIAWSFRPVRLNASWRTAAKATAAAAVLSCWVSAGEVAVWTFWYVADTYTLDLRHAGYAHEMRLDLFSHGVGGIAVAGLVTRIVITVCAFCWFSRSASGRPVDVTGAGLAPPRGTWRWLGLLSLVVGLFALWSWPWAYTWVRWVVPGLPD